MSETENDLWKQVQEIDSMGEAGIRFMQEQITKKPDRWPEQWKRAVRIRAEALGIEEEKPAETGGHDGEEIPF
jgi:hypothetical protein